MTNYRWHTTYIIEKMHWYLLQNKCEISETHMTIYFNSNLQIFKKITWSKSFVISKIFKIFQASSLMRFDSIDMIHIISDTLFDLRDTIYVQFDSIEY